MRGRWGLAAGAVLLLAVNALVLAGVARNRAAPADSQLVLSERELAFDTREIRDDTDRSLRVVVESEGARDGGPGVPWLDRARLAALGFDLRLAPDPRSPLSTGFYRHQPARPVLLVLELAGPTYRREQARAAAKRAAELAANPCPPSEPTCAEADPAESRDPDLTRSRLYAVDAGLDAAALRRRYPDRNRYAIVAGEVSVGQLPAADGKPGPLLGWVQGFRIDKIDVPLPLKQPFEALVAANLSHLGVATPNPPPPPFRATIAWGRRLEPWIVDLIPLPAAPARAAAAAPGR